MKTYTPPHPAISNKRAIELYGMTVKDAHEQGICIMCKQPFKEAANLCVMERYSEGIQWRNRAFCFDCWNKLGREAVQE